MNEYTKAPHQGGYGHYPEPRRYEPSSYRGAASYGGARYGGTEGYGGENFGGESFGGESFGGESFGGESFGGESFVGENIGGENIGGENIGRPERYGRTENYQGGLKSREDYNLRQEAILKRRQARTENSKLNYDSWENDKEWRPFTILPRDWWRAIRPSHSAPLVHPVDMVVLTYSHGRTCQNTYHCSRETKRMQGNHMQNGAVDIVFNFMIGGNGQVFEGRGWHSTPRLNHKLQRFSRNALHIAFLGNMRAIMPGEQMFMAARDLIEFGVRKQFIAPKFLEFSTRLWSAPETPTDSEVLKNLAPY